MGNGEEMLSAGSRRLKFRSIQTYYSILSAFCANKIHPNNLRRYKLRTVFEAKKVLKIIYLGRSRTDHSYLCNHRPSSNQGPPWPGHSMGGEGGTTPGGCWRARPPSCTGQKHFEYNENKGFAGWRRARCLLPASRSTSPPSREREFFWHWKRSSESFEGKPVVSWLNFKGDSGRTLPNSFTQPPFWKKGNARWYAKSGGMEASDVCGMVLAYYRVCAHTVRSSVPEHGWCTSKAWNRT